MVSILHLHLGNDFKVHWNETLQFLAFYSSEGRCTHPPSKTGKSQITKIFLNALRSLFLIFTAHSNKAAAHTALPDVENTFTCTSSRWPSPILWAKARQLHRPSRGGSGCSGMLMDISPVVNTLMPSSLEMQQFYPFQMSSVKKLPS